MAYKFNGGIGAVICDQCKVIFDADLSFREYEECYYKSDGDFCVDCNTGHTPHRTEAEKRNKRYYKEHVHGKVEAKPVHSAGDESGLEEVEIRRVL